MLSRLKYDLTMAEAARGPGGSRGDLLVVADMVARGARVLDVGCDISHGFRVNRRSAVIDAIRYIGDAILGVEPERVKRGGRRPIGYWDKVSKL